MSKASFTIDCVLESRAMLGESPTWCVDSATLYWIDIAGKAINRFDPASGSNETWTAPSTPGCLVLREGGGLVIAAHDGIYDFEPGTGQFEKLADVPYNPALFRFNDGKTDRQGRLWVGSMALDPRLPGWKDTGILHCFDGVSVRPAVAPIWAANGTAFSPDGRTLYRAETLDREIIAYDYDPETAQASNARLFATVPSDLGVPDGATVDSEGGYWAALPVGPDGGSVIRFDASGKLDFHFETPTSVPTMVAFGGADMATLYIVTARLEHEYEIEESPLSGHIFAAHTSFRGVPEAPFRRP